MEENLIIFESIFEGGTFHGAEISIMEIVNDVPIPVALNGSNVVCQMKKDGTVHAEYKTADNTISVSMNKIIFPKHNPTLKSGLYEFDFNIILPDGTKEPGIGQGEWTILEPKTKR